VSLFVLSPEAKDRDEVEVGNWVKHKKIFYSESYRVSQKKDESIAPLFIGGF
jgi:hypothetical protein